MGAARVNISAEITSSAGGGNSTATLPAPLSTFSAVSGNTMATLKWEYSSADYLAGIRITYKAGSLPENPSDGAYIDIEGADTLTTTVTGLANSTTYYFRAFPYNDSGDYQTAMTNASASCIPIPTNVVVEGVTAAVETGVADNLGYAIISSSGTFTITAADAADISVYMVGGGSNGDSGSYTAGTPPKYSGGSGGSGGYVTTFSIEAAAGMLTDTATIGAVGSTTGSQLVHDGTTYNYKSGAYTQKAGGNGASYNGTTSTAATNGADGIEVPVYGYIGSSGGGGNSAPGGIGAGSGGNGSAGDPATNYGCGGGGGSGTPVGTYPGGAGMKGAIILTWQL